MRLVCPNCGAQYDVPLEVIPEAGRDVQCSNCGNTWFQRRVQQPAPAAPAAKPAGPDSWQQTPPTPQRAAPAPPPAQGVEPKRSVDPEMAELFREEREYEERQRSAAAALETQPDLGLTAPDEDAQARRARESRDRMARMRGEDLETAPPPHPTDTRQSPRSGTDIEMEAAAMAAASASRRGLLPDVDEINQTLRASSEPRVVDGGQGTLQSVGAPRQTGSPFARGFVLMALLAVCSVAAYVKADDLSDAVPQAAPYLETYVQSVDAGRVWLDGQVKTLLQTLDQMSSEVASPEPDTPEPDTDAPTSD